MIKQEKQKKYLMIAEIILSVVVIAFGIFYVVNSPSSSTGSKAVTVTVVNSEGEENEYSTKTDEEYLSGLLYQLEDETDFTMEAEDSDYGIYINSVNGELADYDADGAYWAIYVNDEYGMYGADEQVVNDGDEFELRYEVYEQ